MAFDSSQLHRLRIREESTFGTDMTSVGTSFTSFLELPIQRGSFAGGRADSEHDPQTQQQQMDEMEFYTRGQLRCAPAWSMLLHSHGRTLDGTNAPPDETDWGLALLLKIMMGGISTETIPSATTEVQSGTTTTVVNVTAGHGTRFVAGGAIACTVAGKLEIREILSISTDAISVKVAFSGIPATASDVIRPVTFYLTEDPSTSLQIAYEGKETSHRYGYLGCNGGFAIAMENESLVTLSPSLTGASWLKYGTATLADATVADFEPIYVKDSEFILGEVGSTTRNLIHASTRTWTPNLVYQLLPTSSGVEGVERQRRLHQPPVLSGTASVRRNGSGYDWEAAQAARTELAFFQQLGSAVGKAILLSAPTAQLSLPTDSDLQGIDGVDLSWKARNDQAISSPSSDLEHSAFRIHCA